VLGLGADPIDWSEPASILLPPDAADPLPGEAEPVLSEPEAGVVTSGNWPDRFMRRGSTTLILAGILALVLGASPLHGSSPRASEIRCARFAGPTGSDAWPGTFARPPAHAEEMYNPAVHGRSDGGTFTVTAKTP
jgi:hypothetical protein